MRVKVLKLDPKADIPYPAHNDDYCVDLTACRMEKIGEHTYKYYLGIALQIDRTWNPEIISPRLKRMNNGAYGDFEVDIPETTLDMEHSPLRLAFKAYARSSCHKHGMILTNGTGIIDEGYTGEIAAVFFHYDPSLPPYQVGDKVCQIALEARLPMDFASAVYLEKTERGAGGFGSSDK